MLISSYEKPWNYTRVFVILLYAVGAEHPKRLQIASTMAPSAEGTRILAKSNTTAKRMTINTVNGSTMMISPL